LATSVGALAASGRPSAAAVLPLRESAAVRDLLFGSMLRLETVEKDPAYAQLVLRECSLYVCADMHWRLVAPSPTRTELGKPDAERAWAHGHGLSFRGHALVWHRQVPTWFGDLPDRSTAASKLQDHIQFMCRHFAGQMQSWDVVNEAIQTKGGINGLRKTVFLEKIGPDYLDIAFGAARDADPKALLTLNEFGVEFAKPDQVERRRALLKVVDDLKQRNVPLDAIGLQSHLDTAYADRLDEASLARFLQDIADRGLKIMVTELDVVDRASPGDIGVRDAEVAALYKRYLDVVLDSRATVAVATWGLVDKESWITRGDQPNFRRADGLSPRPLLFDDSYRPKPAYAAVAEAFSQAVDR
jgi:endo-1,4-beta-xylanase